MIKKRLVASVIVKNDQVVQSFNYKKFLPVGKIKPVIANLERWAVDEIIVSVIDRTLNSLGPNYKILNEIKELSINTPLTYSGGIRNLNDAVQLIKNGADRVCVESLVTRNYDELKKISYSLGRQSLIVSIPLFIKNNTVHFYDYLNKTSKKIPTNFLNIFKNHICSEVIVKDINAHNNQDVKNFFDYRIIKKINFHNNILILDGGVDSHLTINKMLSYKNVSAAVIGNSLYHKELSYQFFKKLAKSVYLRKETYSENI